MKPAFKTAVLAILFLGLFSCAEKPLHLQVEASEHDLRFNILASTWDEAIPLGNGMVGALIWEKEGKLRFSLDRADLWDLRPMENLNIPEWRYSWVHDQWKKNEYEPVQKNFDVPYDKSPAPSKIPGAALEFDTSSLGKVISVQLYLKNAICEIKWENGTTLQTFVHATEPSGWYSFENLAKPLPYTLVPPPYAISGESDAENPVTGQDLRRLGYPEGKVLREENSITYNQEGWGGFKYQVHVTNTNEKSKMTGSWSISSEFPEWEKTPNAKNSVEHNIKKGFAASFGSHADWWNEFWSKSSIRVPNKILEKQWYLEQYKFGSAARNGAPPISLQAVWTADNGKLPPWKGDFHHDLNTQLSYWPSYSANHLTEEEGFINWLWKYRSTFKNYTKSYYITEGLNVPGVTTLTGKPMGGWIQYSFGPTVSAWLSHHFYLHWRYTMDETFLREKAYPWIKDVAIYLEEISEIDASGKRKLPISSSPEIHDNSREAWYGNTTNFDLAFIRWTYEKAIELANTLDLKSESKRWKTILSEWPVLAVDKTTGLMIAPNVIFDESHRHFSHLVGYHPLGLVDRSNGPIDTQTIINTLANLDSLGSKAWVGYSFSWLANLKARALDGEGAEEALQTFATSFCLPNSFHVNGDQSGKGYSDFTYRPFTLEGNFAFAAGLQEMLLQSHTGSIHLFPAVPKDWTNVSFNQLRTEGAFLVSAKKEDGITTQVFIHSLKGGELRLINPFDSNTFKCSSDYEINYVNEIVIVSRKGETIEIRLDE